MHIWTPTARKWEVSTLGLPQYRRHCQSLINVYFRGLFCSEIKAAVGDGGLPISVKTGWGLAQLQQQIVEAVAKATGRITKRLLVPMNGPHLA